MGAYLTRHRSLGVAKGQRHGLGNHAADHISRDYMTSVQVFSEK